MVNLFQPKEVGRECFSVKKNTLQMLNFFQQTFYFVSHKVLFIFTFPWNRRFIIVFFLHFVAKIFLVPWVSQKQVPGRNDLLTLVFTEVLILNNIKYTVRGFKLSPTTWCVGMSDALFTIIAVLALSNSPGKNTQQVQVLTLSPTTFPVA